MPLLKTSHRDNLRHFPETLFDVDIQLFSREVMTDPFTQINQVAVVRTNALLSLLEEQGQEVISVGTHQIGLAMVQLGRADAVTIPTPWLAKLEPDLEGLVSQPFITLQAGFYVDRDRPELIERIF